MKSLFAIRRQSLAIDFVLIVARLAVGAAFVQHGWSKIHDPFGWMGGSATMPGFLQALAALSEFGGGVALILGLLTRLGTLGILCTMTVAVFTHRSMGDPFVSATGGRSYELALVYLCLASLFLVLGPGRFSADRGIFGQK